MEQESNCTGRLSKVAHALLINKTNVINPSYELIAETIIESISTIYDFNDLSITKDDIILFEMDLDTNGVNGEFNLFFNGNTTTTNYYTQRFEATSTSYSGQKANTSYIYGQGRSKIKAFIKITESGYITYIATNARAYTYNTQIILANHAVTSTFTASSITSLRISAVANQLGIGTQIQLFKLKAEKLFDMILSSSTTNIDITGLNIDYNGEYLLVSESKNATTSQSFVYLTPNSNNTATNYYRQNMYSNGTTNGADRENNPRYTTMAASSGATTIAFTRIKLSNTGNFIYQTTQMERVGTSSNIFANIFGTSTFTMSSITSFRIAATVASSLAAGSRFMLYKLK